MAAGVVVASRTVAAPLSQGMAPRIVYHYVVDGQQYMGKRVQVFYRPRAPHVAVLIPGAIQWQTYLWLLAGLVLAYPGVHCGAYALRQLEPHRPGG